jgi:SAM-dependent methyltransferase
VVSLGTRELRPELMDRPDAAVAELRRSLGDLRAVNRWLGGSRALLRLVGPMLGEVADRPVRILDVATGSGDIPVALVRWAARRGERLEVTATDLHPATLEAARAHTAGHPGIRVVAGDALRLPFADDAFHVATCCTALHHFSDDDAVHALSELRRVATRGIVVLDLRRSRAAMLGVSLLASTVWRGHPITRHDGPVSVRGAFTAAELRDLARRAGIEAPVVRTHSLIRVSLTASAGTM